MTRLILSLILALSILGACNAGSPLALDNERALDGAEECGDDNELC